MSYVKYREQKFIMGLHFLKFCSHEFGAEVEDIRQVVSAMGTARNYMS